MMDIVLIPGSRKAGRCIVEHDFAGIVEQMCAADALIFASPVYFSDLKRASYVTT